MTPRLTPGERPKSSAFTISTRSAISAGLPVDQPELFDELQRLSEPVVRVLRRRAPVRGPAEPLQRQVKPTAREILIETRRPALCLPGFDTAQIGRYEASPLRLVPT